MTDPLTVFQLPNSGIVEQTFPKWQFVI